MVRLACSCALKVPSSAGERAFRQLAALRSSERIGFDDGRGMSALPIDVAVDRDAAAAVLAQDLVRPVGLLDVGDLARRRSSRSAFRSEGRRAAASCAAGPAAASPRRSGDSRRPRATRRGRSTAGSADRPRRRAARRRAPRGRSRRGFRAAECEPAFPPERRRGRECGSAFARSSSAALRSASRSSPKIFTRDVGAHARQHVVEPVRDRLADVDRQRQHRRAASGCRRPSRSSAAPPGLRSISRSVECTPSACSSSSARPVRRPTDLTSGTSSTRRSAIRPTRLDSASETPGLNARLMVKVPSLNCGRNARGSSNAPAAADRHGKQTWRRQQAGRGSARDRAPRDSARLSTRTSGLSCSSRRFSPGSM